MQLRDLRLNSSYCVVGFFCVSIILALEVSSTWCAIVRLCQRFDKALACRMMVFLCLLLVLVVCESKNALIAVAVFADPKLGKEKMGERARAAGKFFS